jgi:glucosamine--fructose-6-phosphate aminotransferase (isomerizing)
MGRTGEPGHVREQVLSKPALLREFTPKFDRMVREVLDHKTSLEIKRVFAFGCGDSHNAAITSRMAFHKWADVPMEPLTAMEFARYTAPYLAAKRPKVPLTIGISVSGEVARTVEGVSLAKDAGAYTLGITCNRDSKMARLADMTLDVSVPGMDIPRVRTYLATQIALYQIALRLAEVRGAIHYKVGRTIRDQFLRSADIGQATHEAVSETVRELAQNLKNAPAYIFVGGGPNYGSAMFAAAKILEAEGSVAQPQDLEEWVHLQRFLKRTGIPTFLIAPPGLSYSRAVEVARVMKRVKAYLIAIVEEGDREIAEIADVVLPVKGNLPEELTPLVYSDVCEIFASDLAEAIGEPYFRGFEGPWATPDGDPIWFNEMLTQLNQLDHQTFS